MSFDVPVITGVSGAAVAVLTGLALIESRGIARAREAVPLRVHVNGTRGKSTTTAVIRNMFAAAGKNAVAKITGELPYVVDSAGDVLPWERSGPARVQEQARFLRWAARQHADVAVVECMALNPEYQAVSEQLIRADIGVITNVRLDPLEEMGRTRDEIARSLLLMTPVNGVLVVGDEMLAREAEKVAKQRKTRVVFVRPAAGAPGFTQAAALAREVLANSPLDRSLRLRSERYLRSVERHPPEDLRETLLGRRHFIPLWTVNDPDSLYEHLQRSDWPQGPLCVLFNHRADRPLRSEVFAKLFSAPELAIVAVLVMMDSGSGARPFQRYLKGKAEIRKVKRSRPHIIQALDELQLPEGTIIVGTGNWKGVPPDVR